LACTRSEILEYLATLGQDFRTDSSNTNRVFTRNRLRTELLPHLRSAYNSQVDDALLRLAAQAGEMQQFVDHEARELLEASCERLGSGEIAIRIVGLKDKPTILVSEVLRLAWREAHFAEQAMTHEWWVQLATLVTSGASNAVLNLPGNVRGEIVGDVLVVERNEGS
jgi:tRNA(Ile)-lysidine synthase